MEMLRKLWNYNNSIPKCKSQIPIEFGILFLYGTKNQKNKQNSRNLFIKNSDIGYNKNCKKY